jgi:hypothetical protein
MKRIVLMVTVAAMMAAIIAPAALAIDMQCTLYPCYGTGDPDTLYERGGNEVPDKILGRGGGDTIYARAFRADRDLLYGQRGNDLLRSDDGDGRDEVYGGRGYDRCIIDEGDSHQGCEQFPIPPPGPR